MKFSMLLTMTCVVLVAVNANAQDSLFAPPVNYAVGTWPHSVFSADFDGDNDNDLAVANYMSDNVSILLNNGDGTFQTEVNYGAGDFPRSVFGADLDGDGDSDLAVANANSDNVSILTNNGDGTFQTAVNYGADWYPISVFAADLDGDSDYDLAVVNYGSNNVSILKNNGDGTFQTAVHYGAGNYPSSVFAADLDRDGDYDLAVANGAYVSILINLSVTGDNATCYNTNGSPFERSPCKAWGFENKDYLCQPECDDFPSEELFKEAFDIQSFWLSPAAYAYYLLLKKFKLNGGWGGSCYGMAYTCQLLKDGFHSLNDMPWTDKTCPWEIMPEGVNSGCQTYINKYFLYQFGYYQMVYQALHYGADATVSDLYETFNDGASAALSMTWKDSEGVKKTHAVTPICIEQSPADENEYFVTIYDNNEKSTDYTLLIDTESNLWGYERIESPYSCIRIGLGVQTAVQTLPAVIPFIPQPFKESDTTYVIIGVLQNDDILIKRDDDSLGYVNHEIIDELNGGSFVFPTDDSLGIEFPPLYVIPNSDFNVSMLSNDEDTLQLFVVRPGMLCRFKIDSSVVGAVNEMRFDSSQTGFLLSVSSPAPQPVAFDVIKVNAENERALSIEGLQISADDSLAVVIDDLGGDSDDDYRVDNYGASQVVVLKIECFQEGSDVFLTTAFAIDSHSTCNLFLEPDSAGELFLTVEVDWGMDGTPDTSFTLPNEYPAYICGDVDGSGAVNVADLTYLVDYMFFEGSPPPILEAANVDGDGGVNIGDLTYLVDYLFFEGPAPVCGPIE